jgi:hypothetical protein
MAVRRPGGAAAGVVVVALTFAVILLFLLLAEAVGLALMYGAKCKELTRELQTYRATIQLLAEELKRKP